MNVQSRDNRDSLTRRQFLTRQGAALGGIALAGLLPQQSLLEAGEARASKQNGATSRPVFPLKVSQNRRYLVDSSKRPYFVMGDTPWFLQKLRLNDACYVMDDRKKKGFNTLFLEILDDSHLPSRDAYGHVAFEPELDITRPVEAYWRYADTVMEEAARRGFFVIMSELWYGSGRGLWMHHVTPQSAKVYGHFLGKRYARFNNLMWMHCGDRNPDQRLIECANQLALAIREEAPHQLHTAHLQHEFSSADSFNKETWLDVNMAYTYAASYIQVAKEYQRHDPIRPVILGETGYEDEPNAIELLPDAKRGDLWNPYRIRRNAWWAVLSGACGYCAGTRLWRYESNWRQVLNKDSSRQAPLILELLGRHPWWRLAPDVKHKLVTGGYGDGGDGVTAALADDGSLAVAYLPSLRKLKVDLSRMAGQITTQWFDPAGGVFVRASDSSLENKGMRDFTPPGKNAEDAGDWVLLLHTEHV